MASCRLFVLFASAWWMVMLWCPSMEIHRAKKNMDLFLYNLCKDKPAHIHTSTQSSTGDTFHCDLYHTMKLCERNSAHFKRDLCIKFIVYNVHGSKIHLYILLVDTLTETASMEFIVWIQLKDWRMRDKNQVFNEHMHKITRESIKVNCLWTRFMEVRTSCRLLVRTSHFSHLMELRLPTNIMMLFR